MQSAYNVCSHRNGPIPASQAHYQAFLPPCREIDRMSRQMCASLFKTRSMYAQQPVLSLRAEAPFVVEENPLISAMRRGRQGVFYKLYLKHYREAQVNQLMFNLFVYGPAFAPQNFISPQLFERDASGKTALHYAAAGGVALDSPTVRLRLLGRFAGVQDHSGVTALMISAFLGHAQSVRILASKELALRDAAGRSAIMHACAGRYVEIVVQLWRECSSECDAAGMTVDQYVTKYGIRERVQRMLGLQVGKSSAQKHRPIISAESARIDVISRMSAQQYVSIYIE